MSTLAADVSTLATGLNGLRSRLLQIQEYLGLVLDGKLPVNHDIMYQLQVRCPIFSHVCVGGLLSGKLPVIYDIMYRLQVHCPLCMVMPAICSLLLLLCLGVGVLRP